MRYLILSAATILLIALPLSAQTPLKPTAPGTPGDPVWQGKLRMSDGRTFITDGGLAVDSAVAKPTALPTRDLPAKVLEGHMNASQKDECGFPDLTLAVSGKTYVSPSGIALNATYVNYLRRLVPRGSRFRMTEPGRPVLLVADGTPIAVLMPVKQ